MRRFAQGSCNSLVKSALRRGNPIAHFSSEDQFEMPTLAHLERLELHVVAPRKEPAAPVAHTAHAQGHDAAHSLRTLGLLWILTVVSVISGWVLFWTVVTR
jgi:hypothetical protein